MWDKPAFGVKSGKPAFVVSDDTKEKKFERKERLYGCRKTYPNHGYKNRLTDQTPYGTSGI